MPRRKASDQVEALRRQQADIAAKLKEAEAVERQNRKEQDRKRQELAGRVALALLAQQPEPEVARLFRAALAEQLTRPAERALFDGLPALEPAPQPAPKPEKAARGATGKRARAGGEQADAEQAAG